MKRFLKNVRIVFVGCVLAGLVMMGFECINSFIFPLPAGMDVRDITALQAYTDTLPRTAFILVLCGRITGSFLGGLVTTKLSHEKKYRLSLIVGILLTLMGIANNLMIGHTGWFNVIGLPMFLIFTYLGHKVASRK